MDFNGIPQLSKEELDANRAEFKITAVKSVRDSIEDQFTENYDGFKHLIGCYNQLVGSYINQIKDVTFDNMFILNYNSFCTDLLAMFDEYVKSEAKLDDIFVDPPFEIILLMVSGEDSSHDKIQKYMHDMVNNVIADPFFANIHDRFLVYKLGEINGAMIKADHLTLRERLTSERDSLLGMLDELKQMTQDINDGKTNG